MAMEPTARDLRSRIQVLRRTIQADNAGGTAGPWVVTIRSRFAKLTPMTPRRRGEDVVIATRLQGTALWDCWVRWDSLTSQIEANDQVIDLRGQSGPFIVRFAEDMNSRRRWILLQLESGVAL